MKTYRVFMVTSVSTAVDVEAESIEDALEKVYEADNMPGSITQGAFGNADVDCDNDWEPLSVYEDDVEVWRDKETEGVEMIDLDSFLAIADKWSDLGSSVQDQLQDAMDGNDLDDLNPNALKMIVKFLDRYFPGDTLTNEIKEYLK